jgi:hypothetical protein
MAARLGTFLSRTGAGAAAQQDPCEGMGRERGEGGDQRVDMGDLDPERYDQRT